MNKREEAVLIQVEEVIRTLRGLVELQKGQWTHWKGKIRS